MALCPNACASGAVASEGLRACSGGCRGGPAGGPPVAVKSFVPLSLVAAGQASPARRRFLGAGSGPGLAVRSSAAFCSGYWSFSRYRSSLSSYQQWSRPGSNPVRNSEPSSPASTLSQELGLRAASTRHRNVPTTPGQDPRGARLVPAPSQPSLCKSLSEPLGRGNESVLEPLGRGNKQAQTLPIVFLILFFRRTTKQERRHAGSRFQNPLFFLEQNNEERAPARRSRSDCRLFFLEQNTKQERRHAGSRFDCPLFFLEQNNEERAPARRSRSDCRLFFLEQNTKQERRHAGLGSTARFFLPRRTTKQERPRPHTYILRDFRRTTIVTTPRTQPRSMFHTSLQTFTHPLRDHADRPQRSPRGPAQKSPGETQGQAPAMQSRRPSQLRPRRGTRRWFDGRRAKTRAVEA
jgi:hypothetical protein